MNMKTLLPLCSAAGMLVIFAQSPSVAQTASPAPSATIAPTATASASPAGDLADKIHQRFEKKFGRHHGITIDTHDFDGGDHGDIPPQVIPIVVISLLAVFGTPVLIVALAGMFIFSASRQRHRTIRMMVEKGQPVPAELLLAPAPACRYAARSHLDDDRDRSHGLARGGERLGRRCLVVRIDSVPHRAGLSQRVETRRQEGRSAAAAAAVVSARGAYRWATGCSSCC